jgi:hypothetical protein
MPNLIYDVFLHLEREGYKQCPCLYVRLKVRLGWALCYIYIASLQVSRDPYMAPGDDDGPSQDAMGPESVLGWLMPSMIGCALAFLFSYSV